jgi:glucose/arabinose dehydrogenase
MRRLLSILLIGSLFLGIGPDAFAHAAEVALSVCRDSPASGSFPPIRLEPVARGLSNPVGLVHAGDGTGRLFIVEQPGMIRVLEKGTLRKQPFLDLKDKVLMGGEMGLLGLAFHPHFKENGRLFVNYNSKVNGTVGGLNTIIAEFRVGRNAERVDPATERTILEISQPYSNHKGGHLAFGPDGMLYIGTGDGGKGNDPHDNGQSPGTLLGKMLRIDVDKPEGGKAYGIPPDNPFVGQPKARSEIWAYGLRNPWRYSFDALTGLLYAGDVGQNEREEIDVVRKGRNYGWRIMEGTICTPGVNSECEKSGLELPIHDYPRSEGFVVIGGYVYRGKTFSGLCGVYVYGDYGNGRISGLRYDGRSVTANSTLLETQRRISSFGEDEQHELYVVDHKGEVLKIVSAKP